jgi:hypothetical protein
VRTGPMVRRDANVSHVSQRAPSNLRPPTSSATAAAQPVFSRMFPAATPVIESSCLHVEFRIPIDLRRYLKKQLALDCDDETLLNLAAHANGAMLSKLARAIRRFSTERARTRWSECAVTLATFEKNAARGHTADASHAILCLGCARIEFDEHAAQAHHDSGCLVVDLSAALGVNSKRTRSNGARKPIADRLQVIVEQFRALRAAFHLPHYDLDCYVTNSRVTFTWSPLSSGSGEGAL